MAAKILVIDDEPELLENVRSYLAQNSFSVLTARNGSDGLLLARDSAPGLVLADAEMPGIDGHSLCRMLRRGEATRGLPVVLMSGSRVEDSDVVAGFEGGADDYILKPFHMKVLLLRLKAVLRRFARSPALERRLKARGIVLDPANREARLNGKPVALTRKEFDLLSLLIEKAGRVLSHAFLLESVWGYDLADYNDPHTVETHVSRLRKKIGAKHIANVPGHGYKFIV